MNLVYYHVFVRIFARHIQKWTEKIIKKQKRWQPIYSLHVSNQTKNWKVTFSRWATAYLFGQNRNEYDEHS